MLTVLIMATNVSVLQSLVFSLPIYLHNLCPSQLKSNFFGGGGRDSLYRLASTFVSIQRVGRVAFYTFVMKKL